MALFRWRWGRPQVAIPIQDARFLVVDTELTGLDPVRDDIIEIGAVWMQGGRLLLGDSFHARVRPTAALDRRTVVIHGILPSQLEARPLIDTVLPAFLAHAGPAVLVGHCLGLDLAFLNREARRCTGAALGNPVIDTLALFGWLRHRLPGHPGLQLPLAELSLTRLARAFDIPVGQAHSALADACTTAQLFQRFLPLLAAAGITHLPGLLRVGDPSRQAEQLLAPGGQIHF